ncbi:MAG: DUF4349 domain-containing protein [Flexilinea sp.]
MKKRIILLIFILAIILTGCAKKEQEARLSMDEYGNAYLPANDEYADYASGESAVGNETVSKSLAAAPQASSIERMIVRSANLTIEVFDPVQALNQVNEIATRLGGYIVSSTNGQRYFNSEELLPYGEASIRVPADRLEEALSAIEALTTDTDKYVSSKTISGNDITSDYIDSQSRLNSLETTRTKLYEIMDTAATAEETLAVYTEISDIESQIEVLKGQMKYMEESAALSSIYVILNPVPPEKVLETHDWAPKTIVKDAVQALINLGQILAEILIYIIITLLPIVLVIGIPLFFIIRAIKKSRKSKKGTKKENTEISGLGKSE